MVEIRRLIEMEPLRCLIVDDEPLAHRVILEYVKEVDYLEVVGQCFSATEALSILNREPIDLVFLDIQMPKLKGLDMLRAMIDPPLVIVTTAYEEYAVEGFELNVCDYLLKPFRLERFLKATQRALRLSKKRAPVTSTPQKAPVAPEKLFIKSDKRLVQVILEEIVLLESYGNYVKVWTGTDYLLTPGTLTQFQEELTPGPFFRIHKSFIIQRRHIDYVEGHVVRMRNGRELPVGKGQRKAFREFLTGGGDL
jgi:DNA-binding LytR/AlgR family response regulator